MTFCDILERGTLVLPLSCLTFDTYKVGRIIDESHSFGRLSDVTNSVDILSAVNMRTKSTIKDQNGITWYYEQEGSGPHVVLIPDGLGECHMFDKSVSVIAAAGFTVTTFDTPGMSRSDNAPPDSYTDVSCQKLAGYVISLLDALGIKEPAAFWGSSSGGATVLALAIDYPERVRNGMPHEVPRTIQDGVTALGRGTDEEIVAAVGSWPVASGMASAEDWASLGDEAHARLSRNYVRWGRGYPHTIPASAAKISDDDLLKRPLDWSVGFATQSGFFADNIVTATKMGIPFKIVPGSHFPYLSEPEKFAEYIIETCRKYV